MPPPTSAELRGRRRVARASRTALPLAALALLAGGCGASLGGRYDSATTAPGTVRQTGATASVLRVVTAQPLPTLDPAFATTRQSRAVANALCTPLVRYADAQGLPGTVIVPGLARDLPIVSRGSRTFRLQLLAGLRFANGRRLTTEDVRATFERLLDPATGSPGAVLFNDIVGARTFADGEDRHLRGVRANGGQITFTLKRSDPAFMARLAMPIACPVESSTPHREVPGLLARQATGRYRVVESSSSLIDLQRVRAEPASTTAARRARRRASRSSASATPPSWRRRSAPAPQISRSTTCPAPPCRRLRSRRARWPCCASIRRNGPSPTRTSAGLCRWRSTGRTRAGRRRRCRGRTLAPARPTGAARAAARSVDGPGAAPARRSRGHPAAHAVGRAGAQARIARAIGDQLASIGVQIDVQEADAAQRPPGARAWIEWLDASYGDPAAVFMPLADALAKGSQAPLAKRVRRAARLTGDARRAAFRRLDERLGAGGLGAIPLLRANFSTPISSMLVGRGTHPVFDVDLALLSTHS